MTDYKAMYYHLVDSQQPTEETFTKSSDDDEETE